MYIKYICRNILYMYVYMLYVCIYILYVCITACGNVVEFSITKKSES